MNKYRVLKAYPKQITNSGRLITLKPGGVVYLKTEAQVLRLIKLGFIKPVVEIAKRPKKEKPAVKVESEENQPSQNDETRRKAKSEFLSKKNKSE